MTKEITPQQYADYLGCTTQNVTKHIRNGVMKRLPDVHEIKYFSRFILLVVDENLQVPEIRKKWCGGIKTINKTNQ